VVARRIISPASYKTSSAFAKGVAGDRAVYSARPRRQHARAIDIVEGKAVNEAAFRQLFRQAVA
jgi:hypothetical protein